MPAERWSGARLLHGAALSVRWGLLFLFNASFCWFAAALVLGYLSPLNIEWQRSVIVNGQFEQHSVIQFNTPGECEVAIARIKYDSQFLPYTKDYMSLRDQGLAIVHEYKASGFDVHSYLSQRGIHPANIAEKMGFFIKDIPESGGSTFVFATPSWAPLLLLLFAPLVLTQKLLGNLRRRKWVQSGRCASCGYPLQPKAGLSQCSECGLRQPYIVNELHSGD